MEVRELMTAPAHTIAPSGTLHDAAGLMRSHAIGCVLVVDDGGALTGMLTDRDIALGAHSAGEALWRLRIADHMRSPVHICEPGEEVATAARRMRQHRVRRLPVVDPDGRPIGILSLDDLVYASRQAALEATLGLSEGEVDDTVHAVSGRSRHVRPR
jgi:CBS domain-containing protein